MGAEGSERGYELGLGAETWVYENARVEEDEELWFFSGRGTGFGADAVDGFGLEEGTLDRDGAAVDSESDALSQASSSAQSDAPYVPK